MFEKHIICFKSVGLCLKRLQPLAQLRGERNVFKLISKPADMFRPKDSRPSGLKHKVERKIIAALLEILGYRPVSGLQGKPRSERNESQEIDEVLPGRKH